MVASRSAGPLFHKVTVEGADEDLSFNILIPLPTSPQGIVVCMHTSLSYFLIQFHNTAQQPPVQQGNAWYMYGTCSLMHV